MRACGVCARVFDSDEFPRCVYLRLRVRVRVRVRVSVYSRIDRVSEKLVFGSYICLCMCVCACICVFDEQMQHAQTCVLSL